MPIWDVDIQTANIEETSWTSGEAENVVKRRQLSLDLMPERDEVLYSAYEYWVSKRDGGLLPSRKDIDILDITRLIKHTHLIDVRDPDPDNWFFRLVGSIIPQSWEWGSGRDKLSDCPWPQYKDMLVQDYGTVKATGAPMYHEIAIRLDWVAYQYSRVMLPFADDGRAVDTLMSCVVHRALPDLQV